MHFSLGENAGRAAPQPSGNPKPRDHGYGSTAPQP